MNQQQWGVLIVAILVIGFIGAYALIYPQSPGGQLALGALLPIAGGIGTFFFHSASQGFLGQQLQAQRTAFVQTITAGHAIDALASTNSPSTNSPTWPGAGSSMTTPTPNPPNSSPNPAAHG